ncbi:HEAT repeat-containing protein 1 isoform X1 [Neophocaena asiaeorientalis asiaeorientalis]|uniref:HEAT repeat-containing protein 1 n=2 Tax=Neophocaena asiaeorientalis asiaeorientalis TaxID=1706337 RepID=A0A341CTN6_NEOAA|nr:HEAT repeat-containing protein 1 isoform X1 [Neophocaena asiaeorientalis asiaeorientalis]XP_024617222.1 HEAT repeat-containing protein 1 isoform X1 [Neophocaena asiaeorientalis asiaeorientalis]
MTSLAQQLQRLALPQSDPSLLSRDEVASLLFDPKEAATIDKDTAFAIGCTGLEELLGIDPSFERFEAPLFSQLAKTLERSVQTKAVNKQLDENISLFLIHLSPYFLLKPAQKCLEWLIHRFHIHLYNQDSLIACVLPYHETRIFVRVIQLLKINNSKHKWFWLLPVKQSGVPLAKGTLVTHCYKDLGFMDFICSLVTKSVKVFAEYPGSSAQLRVLLTFYASTIVSALVTAEDLSDNIVAKLFPYVQKGLKSSLPDYRAATYMIICQISVKVTMEDTFVNSLASQIIKTLTRIPSLVKDGLGCLIVLLQRQKPESLGKKPFPHLCTVPDLVTLLHGISETYDISPLLRYMLPHLVVSIVNHVTGEETEEMDGQIYRRLLEAILTNIYLKNNLDHLLASLLFEEYISYSSQEEIDSNKVSLLNEQFLPLIRLVESRYPKTLDAVLEERLKEITDLKKQELFHQFISLSASGGKYQFLADSDTSLMLSLNHPLAPVRLLAINHLKNVMTTSKESIDESFIKEAILTRLGDDSIDVVLSAVSAFEIFKQQFSSEVTVSNLLNLFQRAELSKNKGWYNVLEIAADILIKAEILSENEKLSNQVVVHLLPFMVISNDDMESAEMKMAIYLSKSGICSLHPLLRGWKEALENVIKSTKSGELIGVASQKMIELLADNINSGDPSSMLKMVEDLISVGEKESFSLKQKVTFHVIMAVLVSCCSSLKETHFPFATRVFSLLQKKIKKLESVITTVEIPSEWNFELMMDRGIPLELWAHYVEQLKTARRIAVEDSVLLVFSLKNFIHALKAPKSFPEDDTWWNPEQLKEDSRDYLCLLIGLFELVLSGADTVHFRVLMKLFMKVHLEDVFQLFKFFSVLWTYGSSLSNPLNCRVTTVLQTQALYVGFAMLSSQKAQCQHQLASASSPVVTSLLVNLGSPIKEVRRAAIHCLQALSGVASQFHLIIDHVVPKAEEITSDATYVAQDLATLFEELQREKKLKSHQKLSETLKNLLYCVYSCPSYIAKDLMKVLQDVSSEMVLSQLLPVIEQLLEKIQKEPTVVLKDEVTALRLILGKYNEYSASLLHKDPKSLDIFIKAVHTTKELCTGMPTIQITALEKITKPFFAAISDEKVQQKLLCTLFDLLVNCKSSHCAQTVSSVFKGISVNAEQVRIELEPPDKTKSLGTIQQTRRQKMQKKSQDLESVQEVGGSYWQRATLILELLQHKKKLKSPQILIPTLFNLLSRCLEPLPPEQGSMEYTKQLILSCLLNICQKLSPDGGKIPKDVLDEEKFNVELIVQCIRVSEMPQTHHHALLLLGTVAGIFPDKVLHNIMSIFTFMGASVMRLDDTYSFQVINKTVKMVIPALMQSDGGDSAEVTRNVEGIVVKIMNVFVDALPHVPEHRRLPVLVQLVGTLGAERFLWVLLLLLFEQYVTKTVLVAAFGEKDAVLEADTEFWISVCCEFTVQHQIQSLMNILEYLMKLPEEKEETLPTSVSYKSESQEDMLQVFNIDAHTSKQLRHFKFLSVSFMSQLLASNNFIRKVVESGGPQVLTGLEQRLLEMVLGYINAVAQSMERNADKLTGKFWRALLSKAYDMLDKVNALLPTETFIPVIRGLLENPLPSVRRKALDLLNNKLQQKTSWKKKIVYHFLELVPVLVAMVKHKRKTLEEQPINRQTALYTLKLLCKNFGAENPEPFVPVLNTAVRLIALGTKEEKNVLGGALLCVAEVISTLEALAIPQLPSLMPPLLTTMRRARDLASGEVYLLSALVALQKVAGTLPHFISPYLEGVLLQVIHLEKITSEIAPASQANVHLMSLKKTLATTLSPRVLLPAINKTYKQIEKNWKNLMGPFMSILCEHIGVMRKEELASHQPQLTTFFLEALDLRAQHSENDLEEIGKTENYIIDCLMAMVVKLSEVTFRPLFFKLFDWAKTEDAPKDRLLTFYNLADCIAEKLKGLFTLFAGHLVKPFADTLNQVNISKTDEAFFDSERDPEKCCLLLQFILNCLYKIFLFDTQHFLSRERAEALMMPLVDQLENRLGGEEKFQERVTKHLIPCLAQFAVAMADDSLWKPLNYQILLKMRDSSPKVRFAALITVLALAEKLKENYIVLLPESIPFLAELMEDECEEVEHQCQKTVQRLETILGEPLQSYF